MKLLHQDLTRRLIGIFYEVYNELGYGFAEKVYQNSMFIALQEAGFKVVPHPRTAVHFRKREVGEYFPDLIVDDLVILELKAIATIGEPDDAQLQNYLRATDKEVGLLFNFGPEPQFKRKVFTNEKKNLKINHTPPPEYQNLQ